MIPRQRVLVMSTGSELVAPGTPLQPGQIYESNAVMLAAAVRDAGAEVVAAPMTGDDVDAFRDVLGRYTGEADLIITTGGVSAGAYEVVKDALARSGGVRQGGDAARDAAGLGVRGRHADHHAARQPGQRAGVVRGVHPPAAAHRDGAAAPDRPRRTAVLTEDLTSPRGKRQFRRGVLDAAAGTVTSYGPPASHHLRWLASANCLLEIDEDVAELAAGSQVAVWDLA